MTLHCPRFRAGLGLTVLLAVGGLVLGTLPGLARLGPLSVALLLGLLWRAAAEVPEGHHAGIGFAAKRLLRWGIVLLGVRLDFALIARSGWRIAVLDVAVIAFGVAFITWLGRRAGIAGRLPLLLAVGSSICGASAVAAAAPVVRARESEIALAIPLCGVLGTAAALGLTGAEAWLHLAPQTYGILAGSTLHEVAQVIAASAAVPGALESGTVAKLLRVVLLVPVVLLLARLLNGAGKGRETAPVPQPWFVGGFLLVGVANTALVHGLPQWGAVWAGLDGQLLTVANFLMAAAMAGLGLQVDLAALRREGLAALGVAVAGWFAILGVAAGTMRLLHL